MSINNIFFFIFVQKYTEMKKNKCILCDYTEYIKVHSQTHSIHHISFVKKNFNGRKLIEYSQF